MNDLNLDPIIIIEENKSQYKQLGYDTHGRPDYRHIEELKNKALSVLALRALVYVM